MPLVKLIECSSMPSPVAGAGWCVYNNEIYAFGGRNNSGNYTNDIWKYTPSTDTWENIGVAPFDACVSLSACVVNDCGYIGLGYTGPIHRETSYRRDFWEYNFITNTWKRLADFPSNTTVKNCLLADDNAIYALYGFYRQFTNDIYRYDMSTNSWTKVEAYIENSIPRAMDVVGTTCQYRHFVGTGFNHGSLRFWAEWLPIEKKLEKKSKILGPGRNAAACCATEDYVYIAGGRHYGDTLSTGFLFQSIQRYNPQHDNWCYVGNMPYKAENMVIQNVENQLFIGLGETSDRIIQNNWYRIEE